MTSLDAVARSESPIGFGLIGQTSTSRHLCERLSLRSDLSLVAHWSDETASDSARYDVSGLTSPESRRHATPLDVMRDPGVRVIHFAGGTPTDWMSQALAAGKSIIVEAPRDLDLDSMKRLSNEAVSNGQAAVVYGMRRWDPEFLQARSAVEGGRLGRLQRLRYSVHDYRLPGDEFPRGVALELGWPILDQMRLLTGSHDVRHCELKTFPSSTNGSDGILSLWQFADELTAVIEIQTRSLLAYRTGWMLEGTTGAYRNGRIYTLAADGEIIDEPLPMPDECEDGFLDELASMLSGNSGGVPCIDEAIQIATLLSRLDLH